MLQTKTTLHSLHLSAMQNVSWSWHTLPAHDVPGADESFCTGTGKATPTTAAPRPGVQYLSLQASHIHHRTTAVQGFHAAAGAGYIMSWE